MKIARYAAGSKIGIGLVRDDRILSLANAAPGLPDTIEGLLAAGEDAMKAVRAAWDGTPDSLALGDVRLLAPIPRPSKFLGIGFNYQSHVDEVRKKGHPIPDLNNQIWFNKQTSCIIGPFDPMHLPAVSEQFDYECELGVVIGRRCRHVTAEDAHKVIAGYIVVNDASVRDWQLKTPTAILGKGFDTHGPTGPWLTTADEIADPHNLTIRTLIDGVLVQDGNTGEMVNNIYAQIAYLTTLMTLEPGDILATGTPRGVGAGFDPPRWLKVGQKVRIEIQGLGHIENEVIAEPLAETTFID